VDTESQEPSPDRAGTPGQQGTASQKGTVGRDPAAVTGGPGELLSEMTLLRRRTRAARHAYWFPLVLFGLLTCAAAPLYMLPAIPTGIASASGQAGGIASPDPLLGGFSGFLVSSYLPYYWLMALSAGFLLTLLWYRRHARQVGLATPARGYVVTGAVITVLALYLPPLSNLPALNWLSALWPGDLVVRGMFPFLIIAAALCVLAWAERSPALAVIAAVYTGTALLVNLYDVENVLSRLGWSLAAGDGRLSSLPGVLLPALILLAAGAGALAVQRRHRGMA
jgi:hypothetical protein